ncbi:hypothetical protein PINS_up001005 [Pythium insidiosum]|nr:hypothetical protein PINS_up001005 [Pythium insidiosum]
MGSMFQFLAQHLADDDVKEDSETTKLLYFKSHRFMGLTQVIMHVLLKWTAMQAWYTEHAAHRMSKGKEPKYLFLLEDHKIDLQQLLSIIEPLTSLNFRGQAEGPNQVEILLLLYKARETVLNMNAPVTHNLHTKKKP